MKKPKILSLAMAMALVLAVTGCGDDKKESPKAEAPKAAVSVKSKLDASSVPIGTWIMSERNKFSTKVRVDEVRHLSRKDKDGSRWYYGLCTWYDLPSKESAKEMDYGYINIVSGKAAQLGRPAGEMSYSMPFVPDLKDTDYSYDTRDIGGREYVVALQGKEIAFYKVPDDMTVSECLLELQKAKAF